MKVLVIGILSIVMAIAGAVAHEKDIYRACEKYGHSNKVMLTSNIKCEAMKP